MPVFPFDYVRPGVQHWLGIRNTIEFLGVWERLNNPNFNPVEFDGIKIQAGLNSFTLTPKPWEIIRKRQRAAAPKMLGERKGDGKWELWEEWEL